MRAYEAARKRGILDEICQHMEPPCAINDNNNEYLSEPIASVSPTIHHSSSSLQVPSTSQPQSFDNNNNNNTSNSSVQNNSTTNYNLTNGNITKQRKRIQWTNEVLQHETLTYNTRSEFQKHITGSYNTTSIHRILNEIGQPMISSDSNHTKTNCQSTSTPITSSLYDTININNSASSQKRQKLESRPQLYINEVDCVSTSHPYETSSDIINKNKSSNTEDNKAERKCHTLLCNINQDHNKNSNNDDDYNNDNSCQKNSPQLSNSAYTSSNLIIKKY